MKFDGTMALAAKVSCKERLLIELARESTSINDIPKREGRGCSERGGGEEGEIGRIGTRNVYSLIHRKSFTPAAYRVARGSNIAEAQPSSFSSPWA
uniref:Uncharacterized protein n=1 Tax=Vespula pensylvanica TaxID=30213 RepID=A0A834UEU9_VESPE|nr:hypothetical protein H0235_003620 [Vespula pensylvanica]